jgi:hypothetical protein
MGSLGSDVDAGEQPQSLAARVGSRPRSIVSKASGSDWTRVGFVSPPLRMATRLSRFFDVYAAQPDGAAAARHGRVPIPGEATLELPAGRVRIYYEVDEGATSTRFQPPEQLVVRVRDAAGDRLPIRAKLKNSTAASRVATGFGRTYVGRFEVSRPGPHSVSAELTAPGAAQGARLCLGD